MKTIPLLEAKNRLSELLDAVARGEVFAISRRGQICAELRAPAAAIGDAKSAVAGAFAQLAAVREKLDLPGEIKVIAREGLD